MLNLIDEHINQIKTAFLLWGSDWKCRKWMHHRQSIKQWRDPYSGLWYDKKTALKLMKMQALEQLHLK